MNGKTINGDGNVAVTALDATAAANLSSITNTGTRTAAVSDDVTFTGNLGTFTTTVADAKTMTAAANIVAGKTVNKAGTGALAVQVGTADAAVDLTTIAGTALSSVTVTDNVPFTGTLDDAVSTAVASGKTLTAAASVVNGKTINGDGNVAVTAP